jgi:protein-S-isoprenylcysteine O-methyltransferase Ste14
MQHENTRPWDKVLAPLVGLVGGLIPLIENRFFSGTVRIQTERGHKLVSSGPYAWLRHPGYARKVHYRLLPGVW